MSSRRRRASYESSDDETDHKPTKNEKAVARFLRFGLPETEGKLVGMVVKIFVASEAIDALMESTWAKPGERKTPFLFCGREDAEDFMQGLLIKRLFHRAEKVKKKSKRPTSAVTNSKKSARTATQLDEDEDTPDQSKPDDVNVNGNDESTSAVVTTAAKPANSTTTKKDKLAGKKARAKLEMHDEQEFIDGDNIYVWIYDPIRPMNLILGVLILVVVVICCLFPLWPAQLRTGAYYLSLVGMGLLGTLLGLNLIRAVLFGLVWLFSAGKHHFWFLPNLTEDCGFFESFVPLYTYQVNSSPSSITNSSKGSGDKKID